MVELFLVGGERMVVPDVRGNSGLSVVDADDWVGVLVVVSVMMIVVMLFVLFVLFWVCFLCFFDRFLFVRLARRTEDCRKLRKSEE